MNTTTITTTTTSTSYTGIVITKESRDLLLSMVRIPAGWEVIAHHTTMNMGPCKDHVLVGSEQEVIVTAICQDNELGVLAVRVMTDIYSDNAIKHITVAIDRNAGAKPFHSNKIPSGKFQMVQPIRLLGVVEEVP